MDFELTEDQRAIEDAARAFAAAEMAPHSARWDEDKHFPVDVLRKLAGLGFGGLYVREDASSRLLATATSPPPRSCRSTTWPPG